MPDLEGSIVPIALPALQSSDKVSMSQALLLAHALALLITAAKVKRKGVVAGSRQGKLGRVC